MDGIDPYASEETRSVGLALSGGGARGLSAIGILRAFEEKGIEITAIAGTSIGAVIGGLYACGYTPDELEDIVRELDISALISNRPPRSTMFLARRQAREKYLLSVRFDGWRPQIPRALTGGQEITSLLTRLTTKANYLAGRDFTRFPIPFKTVGTDVVSGQAVILSRGSLADAMRASMAFPLAFTGVEQGDRLLMDGGMLMPVPVEVVRSMDDSSTLVVAVNTTSPLVGSKDLLTPVAIANQVTTIMTADKLRRQLNLADLVISPVGVEISSTDFKLTDSLISLGYQAGLRAADSIVAPGSSGRDTSIYHVRTFQVDCADTLVRCRFEQAGLEQPFTVSQLVADLKALARTEPVFRITAELKGLPSTTDVEPHRQVALTLRVQPQPGVAEISFRFVGNSIYDDLTLARQCDFADSLLSPVDLRKALDRIINLYRVDGYDLVEVRRVEVDLERREITVFIDEAIISRIDVANNVRSRDWLLRSYFPIRRGRSFSLRKAAQGLSDLYGTELFERVTFDLEPSDSSALMTIRVKEKKYSQLRMGWHWHDEYQSEQFLELLDDNVNGIGLEFLTHLQYGPDRQSYYTGLRLNRIFFTYLTARLQLLEVELEDHRDHTSDRFGLRTLHLESVVESFDRYPFPTRGKKHRFDLRFAGRLLGGEIEFSRFFTSIEAYYPLGPYLNYHPRLSVGLSRRGLPPSEKFYAGGSDSFAGYRVNELAGDKVFLLNQELRLKLPARFYLTGRFDLGDVYAGTEEIKPGQFRHGFGGALIFDSPIGPFELGFGGGDSPRDRVYFNAGLSF